MFTFAFVEPCTFGLYFISQIFRWISGFPSKTLHLSVSQNMTTECERWKLMGAIDSFSLFKWPLDNIFHMQLKYCTKQRPYFSVIFHSQPSVSDGKWICIYFQDKFCVLVVVVMLQPFVYISLDDACVNEVEKKRWRFVFIMLFTVKQKQISGS